jgi:transcription-repair coupling factor (superfamily II helicase)
MPRLIGLPGSSSWAYLARLLIARKKILLPLPAFNGPLIFLVKDQEKLEEIAQAFLALTPLFTDAPSPIMSVFGEDEFERIKNLALLTPEVNLILTTFEALNSAVPSLKFFREDSLDFAVDASLKRDETVQTLFNLGYLRADFVESPGDFAVRGAVLDFFSPTALLPTRVLLDEEKIASLRSFDPATQKSVGILLKSRAAPASTRPLDREVNVNTSGSKSSRLWEWLSQDIFANALWIAEEGLDISRDFHFPSSERFIQAGRLIETSNLDLDFGARPNPPTAGISERAFDEIRKLAGSGFRVFIYSLNRGEDTRLQELFGEASGINCQFVIGGIGGGFRHEILKTAFYSASEIFDRKYHRPLLAPKASPEFLLKATELKKGDYVVHQNYGVARYEGLHLVRAMGLSEVECARMRFAGDSALYLPMHEFSAIQKYISGAAGRPRLSSLDQRRWEEIKDRVREGVRELAGKLLKTQAEREASPGYAFPPETPMEREFAEEFPYEETPDQARAIAEVLSDMTKPHPMDRLVLGDVGFGKTEVAMRAAFKCVCGGKQTAVLVPTTILAEQHFRTFSKRFADYPVRLGILTRFRSAAEQNQVIEKLKDGTVDVVIGTSRLIQKDIHFKDLGLAIIDEEHRFGVEDKEKIKSFRAAVDILSLSATPIPRTFGQALSGLRALSFIESAPIGRLPVTTQVLPWSPEISTRAIEEELSRGGQVYYVHNRVKSLNETLERLKALIPSARFAIVHGQMRGPEIERAMWDFYNKKFDVLVASSIIESGLDIPSVNTLLVEDAHEFGLAQLYQLRGRIGRETKRAYCYFLYPEGSEFSKMSDEIQKRLEALKEFGHLGSGSQLAMRDMEIRGAGDILGRRQHGFVREVGIALYSQLLNEEMSNVRKGSSLLKVKEEITVDLPLSAFIPQNYFPNERQRLDFYQKLLDSRPEELEHLKQEMEDLSGPAPEPITNLLALIRIRFIARTNGIRRISQKKNDLEIMFSAKAKVDGEKVQSWLTQYAGTIRFINSKEGDGLIVSLGPDPALKWLEGFLDHEKKT